MMGRTIAETTSAKLRNIEKGAVDKNRPLSTTKIENDPCRSAKRGLGCTGTKGGPTTRGPTIAERC